MTNFVFCFFLNPPAGRWWRALQTKILLENTMVFTDNELQSRFIFIHFGFQFLFLYPEKERQGIA